MFVFVLVILVLITDIIAAVLIRNNNGGNNFCCDMTIIFCRDIIINSLLDTIAIVVLDGSRGNSSSSIG